MADISKRRRWFEVWVDRGVAGLDATTELVEVAPGEDADKVCGDVLTVMLSNEIDSGWMPTSKRPMREGSGR